MRKLLFIIGLIACHTVFAQTAMQVMDATASKIKKAGDVKVNFTATSFSGTTEQGRTSGTMCLQGKKMQLKTDDMLSWYDGKTQWSYMPQSGEVNVTNPTEREMANLNPYTFINHYKKGYKMTLKETKLRGKDVYEVHMVARYSGSLAREIYVDVAKSDYTPMCIRIKQDNDWNRITIHSIQGKQNFTDADFIFPKSEYADAEIIDLR